MLVVAVDAASVAFDTLPFVVVLSLSACTSVAAAAVLAAVFETVHTLAVVVEAQKLYVAVLAHTLASVDRINAFDVPKFAVVASTVASPFPVAAVVLPFLVAAVVLPFPVVVVVLPIPVVAAAADVDVQTFGCKTKHCKAKYGVIKN